MNTRNRHRNEDNPIDWSSFDEAPDAPVKLQGSTQLKIMSTVLLVLAVLGFLYGCMEMGAATASLDTSSVESFLMGSGLLDACMLVFVSLLTIIPAAFGFQLAGNPVSFVAPTVFGIVGILLGIVLQVVGVVAVAMAGSSGSTSSTFPWIVIVIPAFFYLFFVVRLHKAANRAGAKNRPRRRPTKEELWDEDQIWKQQ